jgi:hypothetical protein
MSLEQAGNGTMIWRPPIATLSLRFGKDLVRRTCILSAQTIIHPVQPHIPDSRRQPMHPSNSFSELQTLDLERDASIAAEGCHASLTGRIRCGLRQRR